MEQGVQMLLPSSIYKMLVFFMRVIVSSMSRAPFQDARFFWYWVLGTGC